MAIDEAARAQLSLLTVKLEPGSVFAHRIAIRESRIAPSKQTNKQASKQTNRCVHNTIDAALIALWDGNYRDSTEGALRKHNDILPDTCCLAARFLSVEHC